jgi:hypothetical protein
VAAGDGAQKVGKNALKIQVFNSEAAENKFLGKM